MSDKKVKDTTPTPEVDENRLITERRAKLGTLREQGIAYPNDFRKDTTAGFLRERYAESDAEELQQVDEVFSVAGRMMAKRVMGKIAFVRLQDRSGSIQLMMLSDQLPESVFAQFKHWDIGDIIAAKGRIMRTHKRVSCRSAPANSGCCQNHSAPCLKNTTA